MKQNSLILLIVLIGFTRADTGTDLDCLDCHDSGQWLPLSEKPRFDHVRDTDFPLLGTHADLQCRQCHPGDSTEDFHRFIGKGIECVSCHQDIHQNYWGDLCEDCHSPMNWQPAQAFERHNQTLFPLAAAHHIIECYLCHTSNISIPSIDCQDCHQSDFLPELASHTNVGEMSDCSTCHAPTRWNQILAINHGVFFPIRSGNHRGEWNSCSDCHFDSNSFQSFSCLGSGCHSLSKMNSEHCEGGGCQRCDGLTYERNSANSDDCLFCHPQGNESKCGD